MIIDVDENAIADDQIIKWCSSALILIKDDKLHKIPETSKSKVWQAFRILEGTESICGSHLKYVPKAISTFKYHINKIHKSKILRMKYYNQTKKNDY